MTDFEWLLENNKEFIKRLITEGAELALDKRTNSPVLCKEIGCINCAFHENMKLCANSRIKWLDEEYVEPEIDWERVPIDTPILVSNDKENWRNRYFAGLIDNKVSAWDTGTTSWSNKMGTSSRWDYAKVARPEDIEKYRKR